MCSSKNSSMAYSFCSCNYSKSTLHFSRISLILGSRFFRFYSNFFFINDCALLFFWKILQILDWFESFTVRSWCWFISSIKRIISYISSSSSAWASVVVAVLSITRLKARENREASPVPMEVVDLPLELWAPNPILL